MVAVNSSSSSSSPSLSLLRRCLPELCVPNGVDCPRSTVPASEGEACTETEAWKTNCFESLKSLMMSSADDLPVPGSIAPTVVLSMMKRLDLEERLPGVRGVRTASVISVSDRWMSDGPKCPGASTTIFTFFPTPLVTLMSSQGDTSRHSPFPPRILWNMTHNTGPFLSLLKEDDGSNTNALASMGPTRVCVAQERE